MAFLYVINLTGEKEPFSFQKVYRSAKRVGAPQDLAIEIAEKIQKEAYPGIKTSEIFQKVNKLLHQQAPKASLRFNIKEAIRKLGPTGFPFERFIGEILGKLGFDVEVNQHLPGFCIDDYEIDFTAKKGKVVYIGECKYRNFPGEMVHSPDALANYARFLDILRGPCFKSEKSANCEIKTMMVTNTKFTQSTIKYSSCMGVTLFGWRYPKNHGLESLIDKYRLYPVTIFPSLEGNLKDIFVSENLMLVQDVAKINPQEFSKKFNILPEDLNLFVEEAKLLLE